mmetsp:Transcript_26240/g.61456  ORF Transcript_26240/g.61456 Transcript_26240/m.61456 type:complete len:111 (-) Transcript_26240:1-333(-)
MQKGHPKLSKDTKVRAPVNHRFHPFRSFKGSQSLGTEATQLSAAQGSHHISRRRLARRHGVENGRRPGRCTGTAVQSAGAGASSGKPLHGVILMEKDAHRHNAGPLEPRT